MGKRTGCITDGCNGTHYSRGYCERHYRQARDKGLLPPIQVRGLTDAERFARTHIATPGGCWRWMGAFQSTGYGCLRGQSGKTISAHRLSHELHIGPIPDGLHIDHLCRNRWCVNPLHLQAVTCQVNVLRGVGRAAVNATRTHCPAGHEYAGDNLVVSAGARVCKRCRNDAAIAWTKRQRQKATVPA